MRELIERRITELRAELDSGQRLLQDLQSRQDELRASMLRIAGALQVLGELAADDDAGTAPAAGLHGIARERAGELAPQPRREAVRA